MICIRLRIVKIIPKPEMFVRVWAKPNRFRLYSYVGPTEHDRTRPRRFVNRVSPGQTNFATPTVAKAPHVTWQPIAADLGARQAVAKLKNNTGSVPAPKLKVSQPLCTVNKRIIMSHECGAWPRNSDPNL